MKKQVLLILAIAFTLFSCHEEESTLNVTENDLKGTWTLTELYSQDGKITATTGVIPVSGTLSLTTANYQNAKTTFTTNPNTVFNSGSMTAKLSLNFLTQNFDTEETITSNPNLKGEWTTSNNTITLPLNILGIDKTVTAEIIDYDANNLKLRTKVSEEIDIPTELQEESELPLTVSKAKIDVTLLINYKK